MMTSNLETHFYQTLKQNTAQQTSKQPLCPFDNEHIKLLWQTLSEHYQQPHRHYHNLTHIQAMVAHFEQYQPQLQHPLAVAFAVYYHDVIYQTDLSDTSVNSNNSKTNEHLSADFFVNQLSEYYSGEFVEQVVELILMTEKHELTPKMLSNINDAKLFLDIDLGILGQSPAIYRLYTIAIRQEYSHVAEKDYRNGRVQVLSHFLQRDRLYFSDEFFTQYEAQARANIQAEIKSLIHS